MSTKTTDLRLTRKALAPVTIAWVASFSLVAQADVLSTLDLSSANSAIQTFSSTNGDFGDSLYESNTLADVLDFFANNPAGAEGTYASPYSFVTAKLEPTVSGNYTLGQTGGSVDTDLYVFEGAFDPTNFAGNFIGGNEDFADGFGQTAIPPGVTLGDCGAGEYCPVTQVYLDDTVPFYTMVLSHYSTNAAADFALPQQVFVYGPEAVALSGSGPIEPVGPVAGGSVLERVLSAVNTGSNMSQMNGVFANIAESYGADEINGSIANTISGLSEATASVGGAVLAVEQVSVQIGDLSTTVLGAVNTGEVTLGVNQDVTEAVAQTSSAVANSLTQLGGSEGTSAIVLNVASNTTSVLGSVSNNFTALNGSVGSVATTVLGAVNTGSITSGINAAVQGVQSSVIGG